MRILAAAQPGLEGNTTLATLGLSSNQIGHVGAAALAQVLPSMTGLTWLFLNANQIGDVGAAALAQVLTDLRLSSNRIGDAAKAQLRAAKGPKLTDLHL